MIFVGFVLRVVLSQVVRHYDYLFREGYFEGNECLA